MIPAVFICAAHIHTAHHNSYSTFISPHVRTRSNAVVIKAHTATLICVLSKRMFTYIYAGKVFAHPKNAKHNTRSYTHTEPTTSSCQYTIEKDPPFLVKTKNANIFGVFHSVFPAEMRVCL